MVKQFLFAACASILTFSCSGLDDLIFDRHPQLGEMQISATRVEPYDTVWASIDAENPIDGLLSYKWTAKKIGSGIFANGNFDGPTDTDSVRWIAPIEGGFYELKVKVSNTAKESTASKQIEVIVSEKPFVQILAPAAQEYFVQGQPFEVRVRADHANGLSWVKAWFGENLVNQISQNATGIYAFTFMADSSQVGQTKIKIEAKAKSVDLTGSDSLYVQIGGIIPGKNE